jgi:holin-like protein
MPVALLILVGCQLLGELLREAFKLPVPGPVIGMLLLAAALGVRTKVAGDATTPVSLRSAAETLIGNMGLLFVPAGVGIIAEFGLLRKEWLPIVAALIGSTILSIAVTGLVMHWMMRARQRSKTVSVPVMAQRRSA